jgi:hypothetical protein
MIEYPFLKPSAITIHRASNRPDVPLALILAKSLCNRVEGRGDHPIILAAVSAKARAYPGGVCDAVLGHYKLAHFYQTRQKHDEYG